MRQRVNGREHFRRGNAHTRGHDVGDRLLQVVADRLSASVREGDTVARFGGDEFVLLQMDVEQPTAAGALAERLIACLSEPYVKDDVPLNIGVSVCIALFSENGATADHLLKSADIALYKAKENGRDKAKENGRGTACFFEPDMDRKLRERYALERDLREAIAENRIQVHFQPICDISSGRLLAYEALARWIDPERGSVPPLEFIPIAEETGLIGALSRSLLRMACEAAVDWPAGVILTVNLSPLQFLEPDLEQQVLNILYQTGLDPHRLGLELTEGAFIRNGQQTLAIIRALRQHGIRVYLDDFGAGYAGLSYLLQFPFDCIKIDRSLVAGFVTDRPAEAVIRAAVLLGDFLHLDVVAEGVETGLQRNTLRNLGCRQMQGFLIGEAKPARDISADFFRNNDNDNIETSVSTFNDFCND